MKTIALIIPVYNEAQRLEKTFASLSSFRAPRGFKVTQVIFVNDGSTDNTGMRIKKFIQNTRKTQRVGTSDHLNIRKSGSQSILSLPEIISYAHNRGKGYAIREGLKKSSADYSLLLDSDMSTDLTELKKFAPHMKKGIDLVIGTRKNGHSTVVRHQPLFRELMGKGFTRLTKLILGISGTDFTCGFKALSQDVRDIYVSKSRIDRWSYDVELIYLTQKNKLSSIEVPVIWSNDPRTKVKLGNAIFTSLRDLFIIRFFNQTPVFSAVVASYTR